MGTITVIDNEHVTLWYHEETKIVHHKLHKFLYGEPFRETLLAGIELLEKHGATKWLSDDRNNAAIPQDDGIWSNTVWRPRAIEAGWRFWALVMPEKVTGQMSLRNVLNEHYADSPVSYDIFEDVDSAMSWLKAQ